MAGEFVELFEELLFGSGAWIGLIIILSFALLISYRVKYSGVLWCIVLLFVTRRYIAEVSSIEEFYAWGIIINIFAMLFISWRTYVDIKS